MVAVVLGLSAGSARAGGDGSALASELRAEGRNLRQQGELEAALLRFEEAVFESLAEDDRAGAALALVEMAKTYERAGRSAEAAQTYRSALALQGRWKAAAATPLECGSTNDVTPKPADLPGGSWSGYGSGSDEAEALRSVLDAAFGAVYQPACSPTCPDGSTPPDGQCTKDVRSSKPASTKPADYGSPAWRVRRRGGRVVIGPVKITKFPADIKAVQSCSPCTKCAAQGAAETESRNGGRS
jgi:hypothetical protein